MGSCIRLRKTTFTRVRNATRRFFIVFRQTWNRFRIEHPVHLPAGQTDKVRVKRIMRPASRPDPIGEAQEVFLVDPKSVSYNSHYYSNTTNIT